MTTQPLEPAQQTAALQAAVQSMASKGWTPVFVGDAQATLKRGKRPNHVLHLLLTVFTAGLWGFVWLWLAIVKHEKTINITVDSYGNVRKS